MFFRCPNRLLEKNSVQALYPNFKSIHLDSGLSDE